MSRCSFLHSQLFFYSRPSSLWIREIIYITKDYIHTNIVSRYAPAFTRASFNAKSVVCANLKKKTPHALLCTLHPSFFTTRCRTQFCLSSDLLDMSARTRRAVRRLKIASVAQCDSSPPTNARCLLRRVCGRTKTLSHTNKIPMREKWFFVASKLSTFVQIIRRTVKMNIWGFRYDSFFQQLLLFCKKNGLAVRHYTTDQKKMILQNLLCLCIFYLWDLEYFNQSNKEVRSLHGKNLYFYCFKVASGPQEQHP